MAERILVGRIGAAHGVRGEVKVKAFTEDPATLVRLGPLSAGDGRRVTVEKIRPQGDGLVARLAGVSDRNAAETYRNLDLFADRGALPAIEEEDEFYYADLVGLSAVTEDGAAFGRVVAVQDFGARSIAEAASAAGAKLTHISAIGADQNSESSYARTKGRAETTIFSFLPDAVILRPSIMFGPEDSFFNKFASMARIFPALPLVGGGKTKFQPVYVVDVAEAVARSIDGTIASGKIYELGGPEVLTFRQCLEMMLRITNRGNALVPLPFGIASLIGSIASLIPFVQPPITSDQVKLLKTDNVVSDAAVKEGRTLGAMGIRPTLAASILPSYLVQYRPQGQYTGSGRAA